MSRYAVLASGFGSNLQALIDAEKKGKIAGKLVLVISNRPEAFALKRARRARVPAVFVDQANFIDREHFDREMARHLKEARVDYVVLAGYMRLLSNYFIAEFRNRIVNVHPSLLPAFKGAHAIEDAYKAKINETGVTIHFVDEKLDHGATIIQEAVPISPKDSLESLEKKIHAVEHRIYPQAVDWLVRGKLKLVGGKVIVSGSRL